MLDLIRNAFAIAFQLVFHLREAANFDDCPMAKSALVEVLVVQAEKLDALIERIKLSE